MSPTAPPSATWLPRSLRASPRRPSPARWTASSSTCRTRCTADAAVRVITDKSPEGLHVYRHSTAHLLAAAVTALFPGAQCGIGPATDDGFFYDFVVDRPFVPEDLDGHREEDEGAGGRRPGVRAPDVAARRGDASSSPDAGRAAEGAADRREDGRPVRGVVLHDQGPRHVRRLLRRPARPLVRPAQGASSCSRRRTPTGRATRRTRRCSGSTARRSSATRSSTRTCTQIEEAKKRDHRKVGKELGLFMFHPWAPGAAFWLDKGTTLYHTLASYMREVLFPAGYDEVKHAAHLQQGAVGDVRALAALPPEHVPRRVRARADGREGDELPRAHARLRQRGAQLPRPADSLSRADAAAPQRSLGRAVGPDARPSVLAGRRALLRDARIRSRRRSSRC